MRRRLRHAADSYNSLMSGNQRHLFAMRHALRFYRQRAIYSFIPKNACSTLRVTLAIENGCIDGPADHAWIHANNATFAASLESLLTAEFTFVVLRCPYARLASAYLDKLVGRDRPLWDLIAASGHAFEPDELNFAQFVGLLKNPAILRSDIHWRPQADFLVYRDYDAWYAMEAFGAAEADLKRRLGVTVVDARPLTKHGRERFETVADRNYAKAGPHHILAMKRQGRCPAPAALYTPDLQAAVASLYAEDLALYREQFGDGGLLFA